MDGRVIIALDLFPANVEIASTTYSNVRAVVADSVLRLYRLGASGPELFWESPVNGPYGGAVSTGVEVPTENGLALVEQDGGCGCGSALKVADLFPGVQKVMIGLRG